MRSRREFLAQASGVALASTLPQVGSPLGRETGGACFNHEVSLEGEWWFRTDPPGSGETSGWYQPQLATADWVRVAVPHTWQIMPGTEEYYGTAWYRRTFETRPARPERIEFEAVFHSATVWVNGKPAGQHIGKGYTAFALDITPLLHWKAPNAVAVKVDNAFSDSMLPRDKPSDWAHDGGIYRPVRLLITPPVFIERIAVDAIPDLSADTAKFEMSAAVRNTSGTDWRGELAYLVIEDESGKIVSEKHGVPPPNAAVGRGVHYRDTGRYIVATQAVAFRPSQPVPADRHSVRRD